MATIDQNRIRKTSRLVRVFAVTIIAAVPLLMAWYWSDPLGSGAFGALELTANIGVVETLVADGYLVPADITPGTKILGAFFSLLPLGFFLLTIYQIYKLMGFFAAGEYITASTVRALKLASIGLMIFAPMLTLSETLLALALTAGNPEGQRLLTISLSGTQVMTFFLGAVLLMLTRAFEVETERAEEHASIV